MKYKLLYCPKCNWQYAGNAKGIVVDSTCPKCTSSGLGAIYADSANEIRMRLRQQGRPVGGWLVKLCYHGDDGAENP